MDELQEIIQQRVKKAHELNEIFTNQEDKQQPLTEVGSTVVSRSKILANMLRKAKEDEKYRIEKENWLLNILKGIKELNTEQKKSIDIMRLLFPQFDSQFTQNFNFNDLTLNFLNTFIGLYQSFFQPFEKSYEFKSQLKIIVRPQNQFIVHDMIKYLVEFTRDYFTQFVVFWQNPRNRDQRQQQQFQQNQIASQLLNKDIYQNIHHNIEKKRGQVIALGQGFVNVNNANQQNNAMNTNQQIKIQTNPQSYIVTVQSQVKLHQRSISTNNISTVANQSTQDNSSIQNQINLSKDQNINNTTLMHYFNSKSPVQTTNKSDSSKEITQNEIMPFNKIENNSDQSKTQSNISQDRELDKTFKNLQIDRNISVNSNKSEQDSTTPSNSDNKFKLQLIQDNQYNFIKENPQLIISKTQRIQNHSNNLELNRKKQLTLYNSSIPASIIHGNITNIYIQFNKKENRNNIEFKSVYITLGQLSDVMPDIDQGNISLLSYKLRKLKELNSNDQKQQSEDLQMWMRNHFDGCYSRNTRISNSVQGYLLKLEDNYKNNFNFRSKLGEFYKKEVIKNNINTHDTSSLIIKMQQNRFILAQKKLNKQHKTDINFFNQLKFNSDTNLENSMSPLSKKQKSKRQSVHSSQNLELAAKLSQLQDNLQINSTHQINEEDEQSPNNQNSKRSSLNSENKDLSENDEIKEQEEQLKKDPLLANKKIQNQMQIKKKRYNSLPKMRYLKESQQLIQDNSIQNDGNAQNKYKGMKLFNDQFLQQPIQNSIIKVGSNQLPKQTKQIRNQSPLKISNNINDYGLEYKTKIIKLQSNQIPSVLFQQNIQSIQSLDNDLDIDKNLNNNNNNNLQGDKAIKEEELESKPSVHIHKNKIIKIKSVHTEKDEFNSEIGTISSSIALNKVKSTIQQQQEVLNQNQNQYQLSQNLLQKSLSKVTYQSKVQQEKNILMRMGVQKSNQNKTSNPSVHQETIQRQSSLDYNQFFTDYVKKNKAANNLKAGRASPVSTTPSNQKDLGSFSQTFQNYLGKTSQDSPYSINHSKTRENLLISDKNYREKLFSPDKKNTTCLTPYQREQISEQKSISKTELKPLFSEKFKLIVQKTQQPQGTISEFEISSNAQRNITTSDSKYNQFNEQINGICLDRCEISSSRKSKRSESVANVKYISEKGEDNFYVSSAYSIENQKGGYGRASDLIMSIKQHENEQNSMNLSQENNSGNYKIPNQKDFIKILQSTQYKSNALNPHVKQKTSSDFFQQIYAKVQMNRRLLQSSQIRRQNSNQIYFESQFQNNKQQSQQKEQLPSLPQDYQSKNNPLYLDDNFQIPQEKQERKNKSSQHNSQTDQLNIQFQPKQLMIPDETNSKKVTQIVKQPLFLQKPEIKYTKYDGLIRNRDKSAEKQKSLNQLKQSELKVLMVKGSSQLNTQQPTSQVDKKQS